MPIQPFQSICEDKWGFVFQVASCGMESCEAIQKMYDSFEPKGCAQGLPPRVDYTRRTWVEAIMGMAWNFVLLDRGQVVGHAAALPDKLRKEAEYIIFILPDYQNRGLGTALTNLAMDYLKRHGIERVVLEVEADNNLAIHLYCKFQFEFCGESDDSERIMACTLDHAA